MHTSIHYYIINNTTNFPHHIVTVITAPPPPHCRLRGATFSILTSSSIGFIVARQVPITQRTRPVPAILFAFRVPENRHEFLFLSPLQYCVGYYCHYSYCCCHRRSIMYLLFVRDELNVILSSAARALLSWVDLFSTR